MSYYQPEYDKDEDSGRTGLIALSIIIIFIILNGIFEWIQL